MVPRSLGRGCIQAEEWGRIEARCCAPAGLAKMLSKVFVPGFSSESLRDLAEKDPEKFVVASKRGFLGIEEVLDKVDDHANSYVLG